MPFFKNHIAEVNIPSKLFRQDTNPRVVQYKNPFSWHLNFTSQPDKTQNSKYY